MRSLEVNEPLTAPMDENDDIFGPPRVYSASSFAPKNRPSMISAKYKQKEERRKVLKISLNKLNKIEDPEASLWRSVLINNTMKRLQQETSDENLQKQQLNYPRCYDNDHYLNIKTEFLRNERAHDEQENEKVLEMLIENDFDTKLEEEIKSVSIKNIDILDNLVDSNSTSNFSSVSEKSSPLRKRSFDDMDDNDSQDALSQFYMPPTPRMLTGIDDDEDVNIVDEDPLIKRLKMDESSAQSETSKSFSDYSVASFINNNISPSRYLGGSQCLLDESSTNSYSCGHASMFCELQSNVYHNLIASLET
ncbi:uncharacterized protein LOC132705321 [Cylas formicarius]|uniref:uncharacterized protein LOC132705321 n=1 Tax=Cylas formicarius TaxID=197179 RepID=UPI002958A5D9|nr:uncharacterized protein LOC132705321 [Cylas formicarius]XP_060531825.1 uncharacterized protein LOC132705321 [Cylas formicarius]